MKIALYSNHHDLPFWRSPRQSEFLFNPTVLKDFKYSGRRSDDTVGDVFVKDTWVWSIFMGLYSIKSTKLMAHMSVDFNFRNRTFEFPKRVWIQISSVPLEKVDTTGVPLIVNDKSEVCVTLVWGKDNNTYNPYQLDLVKKANPSEASLKDAYFWEKLFINELLEIRKRIEKEHLALTAKLHLLS